MRRLKHPNYNFFANFTWFVPDARKLVVLVIWIIVGAIAGNVISSILLLSLGREAGMEYATLISYPMIFIPAMIFASSKSHYYSLTENGVKLDSSNFAPHSGLLCALVVVAGTLCTAFCADAIAALLPEMPEYLKDLLESMTSGTLWINFLCVSIFAPIFEEWLCRGMVLRGLLANKVKPVWAIVISAVFFAVIHLNPWQAVPAFLLGALFGYVYYKTGSLKLTMLMHFVNNTFALVMTRIPGLEDAENWKDVFSAPVYGALLAACTAAALLSVYFFSKVKTRNASGGCESVPPLFENNNQ